MWLNSLPKVATQWNSGATRESNRGPRVQIPSALTTKTLSTWIMILKTVCVCVAVLNVTLASVTCAGQHGASLRRVAVQHRHNADTARHGGVWCEAAEQGRIHGHHAGLTAYHWCWCSSRHHSTTFHRRRRQHQVCHGRFVIICLIMSSIHHCVSPRVSTPFIFV